MKAFFDILKSGLWGTEVSIQEEHVDWGKVFQMANEQTVTGLVLDACFRNNWKIGKEHVMEGLVRMEQLKKQNAQINGVLKELAELLNPFPCQYVVFKGQTVAYYYPNPALRQCGDIDFYCPPEDYVTVLQLIQDTWQVPVHYDSSEKHDAFYYKGFCFEMHRSLETFGSSKHQEYYDTLMDEYISQKLSSIEVEGTKVSTFSIVPNILQVFKHLFNHLLVEGVGLRQFCDLAVLIHSRSLTKDEKTALEIHLKKIGYYKAFLATGALLVKYIGLPEQEFVFPLTSKDYQWADKILKAVMERGNFGKYHRKHQRQGIGRSIETARIAMGHCLTFFWLAPSDIIHLIPKRIGLSFRKYFSSTKAA